MNPALPPSAVPLTDPDATLYRAIAKGYVTNGVVGFEAFMPRTAEGNLLSTDQARLSTATQTAARRGRQVHGVHELSIADIEAIATGHGFPVPVYDDHDATDPMLEAHASIDMSASPTKVRRQALAASLLLASQLAHP